MKTNEHEVKKGENKMKKITILFYLVLSYLCFDQYHGIYFILIIKFL